MSSVIHQLQLGYGKLKVLIKDTVDIQGYPTRLGSAAFADALPATTHAAVVKYILQHDCQIIGKANLHELAFGITGINTYSGTPINPKYPALIPGGSSSGSATGVAEKQCDFSLGTDTGGSIRMPAACCGVYGLKPTFGRVSRQGVIPAVSSLDCVGPFANDLAMLIQAMQIIDPSFQRVKTELSNIAALDGKQYRFAILDVEADEIVWKTITNKINTVKNINFEYIKVTTFDAAFEAGIQIIAYENWQAFSNLVDQSALGEDIQQRLRSASKVTYEQYQDASLIRDLFTQEMDQLLQKYDGVILPTLPALPPSLEQAKNPLALLNLTTLVRPFNLSGHPALSIPLQTDHQYPVGLQMVAAKNQDEKLCGLAALFATANVEV